MAALFIVSENSPSIGRPANQPRRCRSFSVLCSCFPRCSAFINKAGESRTNSITSTGYTTKMAFCIRKTIFSASSMFIISPSFRAIFPPASPAASVAIRQGHGPLLRPASTSRRNKQPAEARHWFLLSQLLIRAELPLGSCTSKPMSAEGTSNKLNQARCHAFQALRCAADLPSSPVDLCRGTPAP